MNKLPLPTSTVFSFLRKKMTKQHSIHVRVDDEQLKTIDEMCERLSNDDRTIKRAEYSRTCMLRARELYFQILEKGRQEGREEYKDMHATLFSQ